jgi:hypothetical protein
LLAEKNQISSSSFVSLSVDREAPVTFIISDVRQQLIETHVPVFRTDRQIWSIAPDGADFRREIPLLLGLIFFTRDQGRGEPVCRNFSDPPRSAVQLQMTGATEIFERIAWISMP